MKIISIIIIIDFLGKIKFVGKSLQVSIVCLLFIFTYLSVAVNLCRAYGSYMKGFVSLVIHPILCDFILLIIKADLSLNKVHEDKITWHPFYVSLTVVPLETSLNLFRYAYVYYP